MLRKKTKFVSFIALPIMVSAMLFSAPTATAVQDSREFVGEKAQVTEDVISKQAKGTSPQETTEALKEYWTPERMKNSVPEEVRLDLDTVMRTDPSVIRKMQPELKIPEREQKASKPILANRWGSSGGGDATSQWGDFGAVNGKVFFTQKLPNGKYADRNCSASAVNSENKSTVITAGHCVHSGANGEFHKNWVFVPGYQLGFYPHGSFAADYLATTTVWKNYGERESYEMFAFSKDVGFAVVKSNNGNRLVDAVGGHGLRSGNAHSFDANLIGYPRNRLWGRVMFKCTLPVGDEEFGGYNVYMARGCNFSRGISGGPWLEDYDGSFGYIRSVSSFVPVEGTAYVGAPIFDLTIWNLFDSVADRPVN